MRQPAWAVVMLASKNEKGQKNSITPRSSRLLFGLVLGVTHKISTAHCY